MTPAAAYGTYKAVRSFPWLRVVGAIALVCWLGYRYWVAPVLDSIDRVTPWAGVVPGSCSTPAPARPAGWSALSNDAGRLLRGIADGPPTGSQMVGWFRSAGQGAKTTWVAFDAGTNGQQLLPLAKTPVPPPAMQVNAPTASHLTDEQVAALATSVGWPAAEIPNVVARVRAESSGNPTARDYADGTHVGLLQLGTAERAQYGAGDGTDPRTNLAAGLRLWQARGWQPWAASDHALDVRPVAVTPVDCTPDLGAVPTAQFANGQAPADALVATSLGVQVRSDVAPSLERLQAAFTARWGQPLVATDGYRSYEQQVDVKRRKPGLAAKPGTSNHGWGQAVDLSGPVSRFGTPQYEWLLTHAPEFGWTNPTWARAGGSRPEPWHWEVVEGGAKQAG